MWSLDLIRQYGSTVALLQRAVLSPLPRRHLKCPCSIVVVPSKHLSSFSCVYVLSPVSVLTASLKLHLIYCNLNYAPQTVVILYVHTGHIMIQFPLSQSYLYTSESSWLPLYCIWNILMPGIFLWKLNLISAVDDVASAVTTLLSPPLFTSPVTLLPLAPPRVEVEMSDDPGSGSWILLVLLEMWGSFIISRSTVWWASPAGLEEMQVKEPVSLTVLMRMSKVPLL